jgi:hypothetical protein
LIEGEDEETNPGIYGRALAFWFASQLQVAQDDVIAEFGWCVPLKSSPHRLYVACSSEDDRKDRWRIFVFVEGGLFARLSVSTEALRKSPRCSPGSRECWS